MNNIPPPQYVGGQGSPLVLLHGIGGTWEIWKPIIPSLEATHRVIAITLPGHHGGTAYAGRGDATVAVLANQLIAILRAQGIERAHVVGYSFGGWLSIELARRGFARSVVAFSPAGGWRSGADYRAIARSFGIFYALVDVIRWSLTPFAGIAWLRKAFLAQAMEHGDRFPAEEFLSFLRAMSRADVLPQLLRTMGRDGPIAALDSSDIPIRIAWSERDQVIPFQRYGKPFVEKIHGAEVTTVSGVGHIPTYDDPNQLVDNILAITHAVDANEKAAY